MKFNIWYERLRYWPQDLVPHSINFMHIKKNVSEGLVWTFWNTQVKKKD